MPEIVELRKSFNAGEISPWLDPRIDLEKYRSACRTCRNMLPQPYGGAFRRPGSLYIGHTKADNRAFLHPFRSGGGKSWMLEFTDSVLRIWDADTQTLVQDGGSDLEIATPYTAANLRTLHFAQLNDLLFITHPSHGPRVLARYSNTDWRFYEFKTDWPALLEKNNSDITITPSTSAPTPAAWSSGTTYEAGDLVTRSGVTYSSLRDGNKGIEPRNNQYWPNWWVVEGSTTFGMGKRITLTASAALFSADMVGQKWVLDHTPAALNQTLALSSAVNSTSTAIYVLGTWSASLTSAASGSGTWSASVAVQRSFDEDTWETIATLDGDDTSIQHTLTGSEDKPCFLRLKLTAKTGTIPADYLADVESTAFRQKSLVRLVKYLTTTTFRAIVEFPMPAGAGATTDYYQDAWGGDNGWPGALAIHEGRLYFAGTQSRPTTLWGSRVDDFYDFRLAEEEDAAVSYTIASENTSRIRWMASAEDLLVGTLRDEWTIARRNAADTPRARRQSSIGADRKQAILIDDAVLFIQSSKRKIREFSWSAERARYASNDLTILSEHLGDDLFVEFAAQRNNHTTLWLVTNAGSLRTLIYDRSQNITGWARHDSPGATFQSVGIIPSDDGNEDQVWLCVKRTIDGSDVNLIEILNPFGTNTIKDTDVIDGTMVFMDCMIAGTAAAGSITGTNLAELEGETVQVLTVADGLYRGEFTVSSGAIDISADPFTGACYIGIGYNSTLSPTYLELDAQDFSTKAGKKRLTRAVVELYKSRGAQITGNEYRSYVDLKDSLATDNSLFTGLLEAYVQADTERQATLRIRQTKPFPLNVMSIAHRYELGPA